MRGGDDDGQDDRGLLLALLCVDYLGTRRLMTIARRQAAEVRHTPCNFANGFDRPADVYVPRD